jgi:phospho-N-acetylmuramoyl-pentapeptide-transferase
MFYHVLYQFNHLISAFNVFKYITVRSFLAFIISFVVSIIWGKYFIEYMRKKQFSQIVRDDGPKEHLKKTGTPTFGGLFILGSVFIGTFFCGNFNSLPLLMLLAVVVSFFILGFLDDYLKILKKNTKGISAMQKLLWQFGTAIVVCYLLIYLKVIDTNLYIPFIKTPFLNLGYFYGIFAAFVIVASSNAVNLTDGLDGLAIGPIIVCSITLGLLSYLSGHKEISSYLLIPSIMNVGELAIFSSCLIGAGFGFLWYNSYPAQVFMGDVGSLSLGGALGTISVLTKNEILFVYLGGIFVIEALSVIIQVVSFKLRKKRIFRMAPIHHHFELKGWPEPKVIVRFWIISIFLAISSLATLKLR